PQLSGRVYVNEGAIQNENIPVPALWIFWLGALLQWIRTCEAPLHTRIVSRLREIQPRLIVSLILFELLARRIAAVTVARASNRRPGKQLFAEWSEVVSPYPSQAP